MQYILSQEEMDEQREKMAALERLPSVEKLQKFCTFVSDNLIATTGWTARGAAFSQRRRNNTATAVPLKRCVPIRISVGQNSLKR